MGGGGEEGEVNLLSMRIVKLLNLIIASFREGVLLLNCLTSFIWFTNNIYYHKGLLYM